MIIDISPPITSDLPVWPGDVPPQRIVALDQSLGHNIALSALHASVHLGAHADAPKHYMAGGAGIGERDLAAYLGPCQVMHVTARRGEPLRAEDLPAAVTAERLLLATGTFEPHAFNQDFAWPAPELVDALFARGVRLIGTDAPSMDAFDSKDLPTHRRFFAHDMAILEGLVLAHVPDGPYELIALPLRLVGFDASPVRAVLRALPR